MREIAIAGRPSSGAASGVQWQAEALAYFARMSTPPSEGFREAVNWAVFRWKALGAWPLVKGLWILSADSAASALLSAIGDTARDATVLGVQPTFTALKGFSGFDVGKQIRFPITSAILASDAVFAFMAGRVDGAQSGATFIISDAGTADTTPGHFLYDGDVKAGTASAGIVENVGAAIVPVVGGARAQQMIGPSGTAAAAGATTARSSNYRTAGIAGSPLNRLCAYGFLDASATAVQCRRFVAILGVMLDQLGALD